MRNIIVQVLGLIAIGTGAYFTVEENLYKFISSYIPGVPSNRLHNLLDSTTAEVSVQVLVETIFINIIGDTIANGSMRD